MGFLPNVWKTTLWVSQRVKINLFSVMERRYDL